VPLPVHRPYEQDIDKELADEEKNAETQFGRILNRPMQKTPKLSKEQSAASFCHWAQMLKYFLCPKFTNFRNKLECLILTSLSYLV
jgi:hypothetical protein